MRQHEINEFAGNNTGFRCSRWSFLTRSHNNIKGPQIAQSRKVVSPQYAPDAPPEFGPCSRRRSVGSPVYLVLCDFDPDEVFLPPPATAHFDVGSCAPGVLRARRELSRAPEPVDAHGLEPEELLDQGLLAPFLRRHAVWPLACCYAPLLHRNTGLLSSLAAIIGRLLAFLDQVEQGGMHPQPPALALRISGSRF